MDATRRRRTEDKIRQSWYAYWRAERFARFIRNGVMPYPRLTRKEKSACN